MVCEKKLTNQEMKLIEFNIIRFNKLAQQFLDVIHMRVVNDRKYETISHRIFKCDALGLTLLCSGNDTLCKYVSHACDWNGQISQVHEDKTGNLSYDLLVRLSFGASVFGWIIRD